MIVTVECTCYDNLYADDSMPVNYIDEKKAIYMWTKLKRKAQIGLERCRNGEILPSLLGYNMFYGVHLNGLHIMTVRD